MTDGRALVAAYLKELRIARGVEQFEVAERLGVHKNTVQRAELIEGKEASSKLETAMAIARCLGGDIAHVVSLRAERLPDDYLADHADGEPTIDKAADVARWHVQRQDAALAEQARRPLAPLSSVRQLTDSLQWAAFTDPGKVLRVWL